MGPWAMAILLGVLAVALVGAFLAVWLRDKSRSETVSADSDRSRTDPGR